VVPSEMTEILCREREENYRGIMAARPNFLSFAESRNQRTA
jgi:hypothetical protein